MDHKAVQAMGKATMEYIKTVLKHLNPIFPGKILSMGISGKIFIVWKMEN